MSFRLSFDFCRIVFSILCVAEICIAAECGKSNATCDEKSKLYRTFDGTCNNLKKPGGGSVGQPYGRMAPETCAKKYTEKCALPNVQEISNALQINEFRACCSVTSIGVFLSQLLIHDCFQTALDTSTSCCTSDFKFKNPLPPNCTAINIPKDDPYYSSLNATCMTISKVITAAQQNCTAPGPDSCIKPINQVTPAADLNVVYSTDNVTAYSLREKVGGRLLCEERNGISLLPTGTGCSYPVNNKGACYKTGDPRGNQTPFLTVLQTLFACGLHNYIADGLAKVRKIKNDEVLYQDARKLTIAIYENTYMKTLAKFMGYENVRKANLSGRIPYDSNEYPEVSVEASIAFRTLHTTVKGCVELADEKRCSMGCSKLEDHLTKPNLVENYMRELIYGHSSQTARCFGPSSDPLMTRGISFSAVSHPIGVNLIAIDIYRSREMGAGDYDSVRQSCGFPPAKDISDFTAISEEGKKLLGYYYKSPQCVDLPVGLLLEKPAEGALVGETFVCIATKFMKKLIFSDRFHFNNDQKMFNNDQRKAIKDFCLAKILCLTKGLTLIQKNPLEEASSCNPYVKCSDLSGFNFKAFK